MLKGKTPYECLLGLAPSYDHIRIFGCLCYAKAKGHKNDKFASRSRKCAFVGYLYGKKGWKLHDLENKKIFVSSDVEIFEETFPFSKTMEDNLEHANRHMSKNIVGPNNIENHIYLEDGYQGVHSPGVNKDCTEETETGSSLSRQAQLVSGQNTVSPDMSSTGPVLGQNNASADRGAH